jgi:hypothetical protein
MYTLSIWCSHPDSGNDDCNTAEDFETYEDAKAALASLSDYFSARSLTGARWVRIDGDDEQSTHKLPEEYQHRADRYDAQQRYAEQREYAMQQGMGLGVAAYNDAMGWGE